MARHWGLDIVVRTVTFALLLLAGWQLLSLTSLSTPDLVSDSATADNYPPSSLAADEVAIAAKAWRSAGWRCHAALHAREVAEGGPLVSGWRQRAVRLVWGECDAPAESGTAAVAQQWCMSVSCRTVEFVQHGSAYEWTATMLGFVESNGVLWSVEQDGKRGERRPLVTCDAERATRFTQAHPPDTSAEVR